jgi:hypothetical protein
MLTEDFEDVTLQAGLALTNPNGKIVIPDATQFHDLTHSMSLDLTGLAAEHYAEWTVNAAHAMTNVWYRTGLFTGGYVGGAVILACSTLFAQGQFKFYDWQSTIDNARQIYWVEAAAGWTVLDHTWYNLQFEFLESGTCRARLFDNTLAQVGAELTVAEAHANPLIGFRYGANAITPFAANSIYFDTAQLDVTAFTWPMPLGGVGGPKRAKFRKV